MVGSIDIIETLIGKSWSVLIVMSPGLETDLSHNRSPLKSTDEPLVCVHMC
jgi:hypothetical protein